MVASQHVAMVPALLVARRMELNQQTVMLAAAQHQEQRAQQVFRERCPGRCPARTSSLEWIAQSAHRGRGVAP